MGAALVVVLAGCSNGDDSEASLDDRISELHENLAVADVEFSDTQRPDGTTTSAEENAELFEREVQAAVARIEDGSESCDGDAATGVVAEDVGRLSQARRSHNVWLEERLHSVYVLRLAVADAVCGDADPLLEAIASADPLIGAEFRDLVDSWLESS